MWKEWSNVGLQDAKNASSASGCALRDAHGGKLSEQEASRSSCVHCHFCHNISNKFNIWLWSYPHRPTPPLRLGELVQVLTMDDQCETLRSWDDRTSQTRRIGKGPSFTCNTFVTNGNCTKCVQQDFGVNMFGRENQRVLYASERKTSLET